MKIRKRSNILVKFDRNKIVKTCMTAGAPLKIASKLASEVRRDIREGTTTDEIRSIVYDKLCQIDPSIAEQYVYRSRMRVRTSRTSLEGFNSRKIIDSLVKETKVDSSFAETIALAVEKELGRMRLNYVTAPLIREIVNVKLLEHGMESVRARYTRLGMPVYDVKNLLEDGTRDIQQYSPEAIHKLMSDQITREYSLINILPIDLADAHMYGQIHIHDLNYFPLRPTTFSHDMRSFLINGIRVDGTGEYTAVAGPAKNPEAAFMHAVKLLVAGSTECSREQMIEHFNVILAPYVEGLQYKWVKQLVQMVLYEVSQTSVGNGGQAIYSSLNCDSCIPGHLKALPAVRPGGKVSSNVTYADFADESDRILDAMVDVYTGGDYIGKPFVFPKFKVNLSKKIDEGLLYKLSLLSAKFGTPYYNTSGRQLYGAGRGIMQYVTINLPQAGYNSTSLSQLYSVLENRLKKAREVLLLKKKIISKNIDRNMLPFMRQSVGRGRYLNPDKQQYMISYVGLNELSRQFTGYDLSNRGGASFGRKVLRFMTKTVEKFRGESELNFLLSGTPKGLCYTRFAMLDNVRYNLKASTSGGEGAYYYSKDHTVSSGRLSSRIRAESSMNQALNSRNLTHIYLSEGQVNPDELHKTIRKVIFTKGCDFTLFTRDLTICGKCGHVNPSIVSKCVKCKSSKVGLFSRDTGHYQNVSKWTPSQIKEFASRVRYDASGRRVKLTKRQLKIIGKYDASSSKASILGEP
ncbi:MAG: anaerobic ribonucleoside-triphosphate reductase [Candidatus Altiarchaeota archaeon]